MLIKLDDAIAAVAAVQTHFDDGTVRHPLPVLADATYALRALPVSDGVTDEMVERAAKTLCELHIRDVRRHDTKLERLEEMLTASVDFNWRGFEQQARAALEAALGPLPAPPTIE